MCTAYFVVPFLLQRNAVSDVEHRGWKFDSVGMDWLIRNLVAGNLLDFGSRSGAVITYFALSGIVVIPLALMKGVKPDLYGWIFFGFFGCSVCFAGPSSAGRSFRCTQCDDSRVLPFTDELSTLSAVFAPILHQVFLYGWCMHVFLLSPIEVARFLDGALGA